MLKLFIPSGQKRFWLFDHINFKVQEKKSTFQLMLQDFFFFFKDISDKKYSKISSKEKCHQGFSILNRHENISLDLILCYYVTAIPGILCTDKNKAQNVMASECVEKTKIYGAKI